MTRTSTPAHGSRAFGGERATALVKAAADDEARGLLQSAETNLRLALAFAPQDATIRQALARVAALREAQRTSGRR